ncbi:PspC domain-containing protein [Streptomyces actinomycinicus]|uniref:PspC domain-containing protein n=1 Tax=Streptomyces actinomycinicus TaxID=1695166 RepID=A0A937EFY8_9ACTN|nr:PspC domain-containing protein [Streptomyces actinomycinicus]MBL1081425.1 PspC domain-containing protein [Streptomyces actinomycinicus]
MTDHEHAATGPGPGTGPRPAPGTGPTGAAPAATGRTGAAGPGTQDQSHHRNHDHTGAGTGASADPGGRPDDREQRQDVTAAPDPFRRDRRYKMIAGVCAGLGRQTDMDPVIFRITLAVLSATGGLGLIFYGFAWLLVPYEDEEENELRKLFTGRVDGQALAAVLFALVGCGIFLTMLRNGGVLAFSVVLSLLLAGAGYWSRHRGAPDPDPLTAQAAADAPPEAQAPPVVTTYPSWWRDPIVKDGTHVGGTGYLWGPGDARDHDLVSVVDVGVPAPWTHPGSVQPPRPAPPRPRGPRWIGGWVFLLALLAGGLGTGLSWDTHPLGTSLQTGLACALAVFGLGITLSAFLGRTGAGTVFLALVTAGLLAGAAALPRDITGHWRELSWKPAAVTQVRSAYDLGTGRGTLDLTRVHPARGQRIATDARVGAGQLKVIVPADVTVRMSIDVGVGDIRLPGDTRKDVDVEPGRHKDVTLAPAKGVKDPGTLDLTLGVGVGQVEVSRAAS